MAIENNDQDVELDLNGLDPDLKEALIALEGLSADQMSTNLLLLQLIRDVQRLTQRLYDPPAESLGPDDGGLR